MKYVFRCPVSASRKDHEFEVRMTVAEYEETGGFVTCFEHDRWAEVQVQPVPFVFAINFKEQSVTRGMIGEGNLEEV